MYKDTIDKYLESHHISTDVMRKYGLTIDLYKKQIQIPVLNHNGHYLYSKYRVFNNPKMKYRYDKGSQMSLFNAHRITANTKQVTIVEGEFDAIALQEYYDKRSRKLGGMFHDTFVAVTSTGGAGSWKEEWNELLVDKAVHILLDNDYPGVVGSLRLLEAITKDIPNVTVGTYETGVKDVCEMLAIGDLQYSTVIPHEVGVIIHDIQNETKARDRFNACKALLASINDYELSVVRSKKPYILELLNLAKKLYDASRIRKKKKVEGKEGLIQKDSIDIDRVRRVPIPNFVQFKGNVAPCIFHNDTNPSMHYNDIDSKFPNTVKCYACGKFADVIEVVMHLQGKTFKEAITDLSTY